MPEALIPYGWDDRVAALYTLFEIPDYRPARVVRTDRGSCLVATEAGVLRANPYALASRRHGLDVEPVTGDWVAVVDDTDEGCVVVGAVPRWSCLRRRDPDPNTAREHVLAANVDVVAVTSALDRPVSASRVERFVAVAWDSGAVPAVVLTKADLLPDAGATRAAVEAAAPGIDVVATSAATGEGVDDVAALLRPARTLVLLGLSGAGKSTLVNALLGEDAQRIMDVRSADHRGRHTTTARELLPVPGGGVLIDTPGIRRLGLWDADHGVTDTFPEIEELSRQCRFRDCRHDSEPGCAVAAAIDAGDVDARRLRSYRKLEREMARFDDDPQARRARFAQLRARGRAYRQVAKAVETRRRAERRT